jgi:predicted transposase/invertase (TIGR01784 family)
MKLTSVPLTPKHDELFRKALENPKVAKEFFNAHLPLEVQKIIDTSTLSLQNGSFIEQDLRTKISDLLFLAKTSDGQEGYIYLLLEHQSTSDKWMSFRLFKYMMNICERYRAENPEAKYLPLIYPMVFYNGKKKHNTSRNLWDLFQNSQLAKKFWVEDYHLVNVHEIPDEEMKKRISSGFLEYFMKHIRERDLLEKWEEMAPFLCEVELNIGEGYIDLFLSYTLTSIRSHDKIKLRELLVQNLGKEKGESIVGSLAQEWFDEGMHKGFDEGVHKGFDEGMHKGKLEGKLEGLDQGVYKGKLETATNMLNHGLDIGLVSKMTGLSILELKKPLKNPN